MTGKAYYYCSYNRLSKNNDNGLDLEKIVSEICADLQNKIIEFFKDTILYAKYMCAVRSIQAALEEFIQSSSLKHENEIKKLKNEIKAIKLKQKKDRESKSEIIDRLNSRKKSDELTIANLNNKLRNAEIEIKKLQPPNSERVDYKLELQKFQADLNTKMSQEDIKFLAIKNQFAESNKQHQAEKKSLLSEIKRFKKLYADEHAARIQIQDELNATQISKTDNTEVLDDDEILNLNSKVEMLELKNQGYKTEIRELQDRLAESRNSRINATILSPKQNFQAGNLISSMSKKEKRHKKRQQLTSKN